MSEESPTYDGQPAVKPRNVTLYPSDIVDAERIQRHFDLDSFSQAIRRAIRMTVKTVDSEEREQVAS